MPVILSVIGSALCALIVVLVAGWASRSAAVGDTESAQRWFVDHLSRIRGVRHVVAAFDRFVWGGAMVGIALVTVVIAGASVGWIFSTLEDDRGFARFDESAAEWGSEHATEASTATLKLFTHLGGTLLLLPLMLVVGLFAIRRRPATKWAILGFLATVGIGVSIVNNALKWLVQRERPEVEHLASSGGWSFPSGHSAAAAACWAAIALVVAGRLRLGTRRFAAASAVAIAVLVASSRVMLGVHWLTDVIAGVIVGWSWFFLVALIFGGRIQRFGEPAERVQTIDRLKTDSVAPRADREPDRAAAPREVQGVPS
jgi:membrane-associated phospholipid phosphatase